MGSNTHDRPSRRAGRAPRSARPLTLRSEQASRAATSAVVMVVRGGPSLTLSWLADAAAAAAAASALVASAGVVSAPAEGSDAARRRRVDHAIPAASMA